MFKTVSKLVEEQMEMSKYIGKRKHRSQLQQEEIDRIFSKLKSVEENGERWRIRTHALDRMEQKGIKATYEDLVTTIHNAEIIEYKMDYSYDINRCDERVVLRANTIVNDYYNLNVVYSLSEKRIITVWINDINDSHSTLDWSLYDENMKVFGF